MSSLNLNIVPFSTVPDAVIATAASDVETTKVNTHFHTRRDCLCHPRTRAPVQQARLPGPNYLSFPPLDPLHRLFSGLLRMAQDQPATNSNPETARRECRLGPNRQRHQIERPRGSARAVSEADLQRHRH